MTCTVSPGNNPFHHTILQQDTAKVPLKLISGGKAKYSYTLTGSSVLQGSFKNIWKMKNVCFNILV